MSTQITIHNSQITGRPARAHAVAKEMLGPSPESPAPSPELPRFVITLSASPETEGLIRVPLAITGKWVRGSTTFAITREDLESIVRNFRERQNGEINVDYDHASEMPEVAAGGPVPSAGRIVQLDAPVRAAGLGTRESGLANPNPVPGSAESPVPSPESRWLLYGWYEATARARELLKSREYRFISPAIEWNARSKRNGKPQGTTLTSVALTNRPFLEELPQIRLSDPAFQPVDGFPSPLTPLLKWEGNRQGDRVPRPQGEGGLPEAGRVRASVAAVHNRRAATRTLPTQFNPALTERRSNTGGPMKHVNLSVVDGKIRITHEDLQDEFFFDPDDLRAVAPSGADLPAATLADASVVSYALARTLLSENDARGKFIPAAEVFRAQAEHELEEAVRTGRILPRQRDEWRKIALSDLPTFRKLMSAQKPIVPVSPVGFAGTPPGDVQAQMKFLAEQRMHERRISFGQALSEIGREQPDLAQQYRRAVSSNE